MAAPSHSGAAGPDGAVRVLIEHDLAAFVWLDDDLVVTATQGRLASAIPIGRPVGLGMLALFGYDQQIKALRSAPETRLDLPNVAIATATGTGPRLNLHVTWDGQSGRFLLVIVQATGQAELERGLIEQSRKRQLAEAKELEQAAEIKRINGELTRANRDLSEFADIISHDLRAPLRGIRYYAEDLEQAIAQNNTVAMKALADRLQVQSRRMTRMLTDLLEYARAGRKEEVVDQVATRQLVEAIVASLPYPDGLRIEIAGDWPVIETLTAPLDLVLRNLIDNAIKHHDRTAGCVTAAATLREKSLEITIADDGPGIPRHLHEAAFLPFRTLGPAADVGRGGTAGGSGMGLALVRRVVESVGARIELVSDPPAARGATFRLLWPVSGEHREP